MTGLRFFLAIWVILHHLTGRGMMLEEWEHSVPANGQSLLRGGYLAVQTFFILSGFVLARSYAATRWTRANLFRFAMARFARIAPAYLLSLLVVGRFILETLAKPGRNGLQKGALLADYGFVLLGWLGPLSVGWNTPAWSLSCELFFYLCFPLLLVWMRKGSTARIAIAFAIAIPTPILLAHTGMPDTWKPIVHLSDFLAGIAAAGLYEILRRQFPVLRRRGYLLYLPAALLAFGFITHPGHLRGPWLDLNTVLRPLNVLLLLGLGFGDGLAARLLSVRWIEYLGHASYSMYILHVPLLWWFSRYGLYLLDAPPHGWTSAAFLCGVVAISALAYRFVETPANRWLRGYASAVKRG